MKGGFKSSWMYDSARGGEGMRGVGECDGGSDQQAISQSTIGFQRQPRLSHIHCYCLCAKGRSSRCCVRFDGFDGSNGRRVIGSQFVTYDIAFDLRGARRQEKLGPRGGTTPLPNGSGWMVEVGL